MKLKIEYAEPNRETDEEAQMNGCRKSDIDNRYQNPKDRSIKEASTSWFPTKIKDE